jgi:hypothetical protein
LECLESRQLLSVSPLPLEATPLATPQLITPSITGPAQPADGYGAPAPYTPAQLLRAYGTDQVTFSYFGLFPVRGDGAGQTIAIVDAGDQPNIFSDADNFDATFPVSDSDPNSLYSEYGPSSSWLTKETPWGVPSDGGWDAEISLDVEWAHAIAPAAQILLVESPGNLPNAAAYAAAQPGVVAVSMSWTAGGDFPGESAYDNMFTTPAGHNGVTYVAASGDSHQVNWPAVSANVLSVGGTTLALNPDDSYGYETAWSASGGGVSAYEPQPWYQAYTGYGMRSVPDIALDADPNTGVWVYDSLIGGWADIGGTSAAAPQMAAMIAIADEGRALNGLGSLDGPSQTLPEINATLPWADVNAIVGEPSYSLYTGWGSPVANNLIPDLASGAYDPFDTDVEQFLPAAAAGKVLVGGAGTGLQSHGGGGLGALIGVDDTASILQDVRRHLSGGHGALIGVNDTAARHLSTAAAIGVASPDLFDVALTSSVFDGGMRKDGSFLVGGTGTGLHSHGDNGHGALIGVNDAAARHSSPADAIGIVAGPDLFDAALTSLVFNGELRKHGSFLRNHR